jgi:hypothetical protein
LELFSPIEIPKRLNPQAASLFSSGKDYHRCVKLNFKYDEMAH